MKPSLGWLVLPSVAVLGFLTLYPLTRTLMYSFTDARLGNLDHPAWIGIRNYLDLSRDFDWWQAVRNTGIFTVFSVSLETILGLITALLLNSRIRARAWVRTAVLIPWSIPAVVSARIWAWMFNDVYGIINETLRGIGLSQGEWAWLADHRLTLVTLILVDVWKTTPFMALLLLAGLQSIPTSMHEAARVDGATAWTEFWQITLPLLKPALGIAVLFRMLDALRVFDLPFVLTSNSRSSAVISIYARQQMVDFQEVGYGSAASFVIFCVIGAIALIYLASSRNHLGLDP